MIRVSALINKNPTVFAKHSKAIFDANDVFIEKRTQLVDAIQERERIQRQMFDAFNALNVLFAFPEKQRVSEFKLR